MCGDAPYMFSTPRSRKEANCLDDSRDRDEEYLWA
jgi:hypothetical protein